MGKKAAVPLRRRIAHPAPPHASVHCSPGDQPPEARPLPRASWPEETLPLPSKPIWFSVIASPRRMELRLGGEPSRPSGRRQGQPRHRTPSSCPPPAFLSSREATTMRRPLGLFSRLPPSPDLRQREGRPFRRGTRAGRQGPPSLKPFPPAGGPGGGDIGNHPLPEQGAGKTTQAARRNSASTTFSSSSERALERADDPVEPVQPPVEQEPP